MDRAHTKWDEEQQEMPWPVLSTAGKEGAEKFPDEPSEGKTGAESWWLCLKSEAVFLYLPKTRNNLHSSGMSCEKWE